MPGRLAVSTRHPDASECRIIGGRPQKSPETGRIEITETATHEVTPPCENGGLKFRPKKPGVYATSLQLVPGVVAGADVAGVENIEHEIVVI